MRDQRENRDALGRLITWPDYREATTGQRFRVIKTGRTGTVVKVADPRADFGLVVDWDDVGFGIVRGRVVSPAYNLEPINDPEGEYRMLTEQQLEDLG